MSTLNKLAIRGIRSFDSGESMTIKFYEPLTLIVGVNGSGKTTIVECLKYVVTGLMPPNTKVGGAFIHDPKLRGEKEIMAQVVLSFQSTQGHKLVAIRNLQLTVKKATRTMKTLEGSLKSTRNGETHQLSTRVAELDQLLPQYLGVSTAVIDNVIFCHQDESLWPMSDSGTLKKKFDEIFEAQKYTKAIANIKDIGKAQKEELGKYKILEQHAKEDKDRALKAQKRSVQLQDTIEELRTEIEDLGERMNRAGGLARKAHEDSESFAKILGQLEGKRIEARGRQENVDNLRNTLKEVSESDEWLQTTLEQFEAKQREMTDILTSKKEDHVAREDEIKGLRSELDVKFAEKGKYQQEKEEHDRQLTRRKNTVQDTAAKHDIRGYDDLTDNTQVEDFIHHIKKLAKDQYESLQRVRRENDVAKRDAQSQVNKLTERKAALQQNRISVNRQIASNDRESSDYQKKVNDIGMDEGGKAVIDIRIEQLNTELNKARAASHSADWSMKLTQANSELREQEESSSRLNNELVQGTKRAGEMARLAHVKQELKEHEQRLQTLLGAHTERISAAVGSGWDAAGVESAYQDVLDAATRELTSAERDRDAQARQGEQIQFRLKTLRETLESNRKAHSAAAKKIKNQTNEDPAEYEEVLRLAQTNAEQSRKNTSGSVELHDYFQTCLETMEKNDACRMCNRKFKSKQHEDFQKAKKFLKQNITAQKEAFDKTKAGNWEQELTDVLDLKVDYETWKNSGERDIPAMEQEETALSRQYDATMSVVDKRDKTVRARQESKSDLESHSKTVSSISRADADIKGLRRQVDELTAKQSQQGGGRTLDDIQEDLNSVSELMRKTKATISKVTSQQDESKSDLSRMELESRDLKSELSNAAYQLEKKASLAARVAEFKAKNVEQKEAVNTIDSDIAKIDPDITSARLNSETVVNRAEKKEREMSLEESKLSKSVQGLNMLNDQIEAYLSRGGDDQLSGTDRSIKHLEAQIKSANKDQHQLISEMNKINEQLKDSDTTRRQYADNLRYRKDTRALTTLAREIKDLESHNADVDRERLRIESEKYTREHNSLSAKRSGLMGEMRQKDAQLGEILNDFKTDHIDAPKRYKEAHIKVETTKAAVEDLARYGGALDKAIMKYHSLKMNEINAIIDELWKQTYQGTDVDTVMIKAENDTTGRSNRAYNYRVVMIKQGTEMDMRGRCSAGQKVLASIIIRLALAECFSANCGLFALDEPTTNLDRDNIEALARALHGLIKNRREQNNFQLIVITHDEDFLRHMQCGEFADYYYRVSRNQQANSIIVSPLPLLMGETLTRFQERQSIADVM